MTTYRSSRNTCYVYVRALRCAVSPDMKLEQSIQRSQKSVHGIIG